MSCNCDRFRFTVGVTSSATVFIKFSGLFFSSNDSK